MPVTSSPWSLSRAAIRVQLSVLVAAAVLPAFLASIWYLVSARDDASAAAHQRVELLVDDAVERILLVLRAHERLLTQIASQPQIRAMNPDDCDPIIQGFARLQPDYMTLVIRDTEANPVCSLSADVTPRERVATLDWFQHSLRSDALYMSGAFFAPLANRWVSVATVPIRADNGDRRGMVILPVDLLVLNEQVMRGLPPGLVVTVSDQSSKILLRSQDVRNWLAEPEPDLGRAASSGHGLVTLTDAQGNRTVTAFKRITELGWRVAAEMPESEVFREADRVLRNGIAVSVALLLGIAALSWRMGRGIVRPMELLARTARRVAAGDLEARAPTHIGAPELSSAAQAINLMLDASGKARQELVDSEEQLAITLQSIGDAVIATDPQGLVTRMNPVAERLTGWTFADARGLALAEVFRIVNAQTRLPSEDPVHRVLASGQVVGLANHTALLARDGAEYQISDSAAPICGADGRIMGVVLVFSDVSAQYHLQSVLEESEHRYRGVVEATPVGIIVHRHGRLLYANPMALDILGAQSHEELNTRTAQDIVHPSYHYLLVSRAQQVGKGVVRLPMAEWQYVRMDGSVIDVLAQASAITVQGEPAIQVSFMDITPRKLAERVLRENEARYRALTQLSSDWYWEQDAEFKFVRVDGKLHELTGRPNDVFLGRARWDVGGYDLSEAQWEQHRALLLAHQEFRDFELRGTDVHGQPYWMSVSGTPVFDAQGDFRGYRGIGRNVTEQRLAADKIHTLAFYDALTELPNRRLLVEQLKKAVATHARNHRHAALLFIDLDNFKTLNDTQGHETGDLLLRQVARRLQASVREADSVARLGGDEFVVMIEDLSTDRAEAITQANLVGHKVLAAFGDAFVLAGREHRSTPSIGMAMFGDGQHGVEDLLKQADLAMYQAKAAGRNTMRLFDQNMQAAVDQRAALESDLREGIAARQMLLHFQPVVRINGEVTGAEVLVRWQHPVRGRVNPADFIGIAESTRLILPLGLWVLDQACAQLAAWGGRPQTRHLALAVNVSAPQFTEPDFVSQVLRALDVHGADPHKLKLELTESLLADNLDDIVIKMASLRERGVEFALDDFGTGYSSLSYLKRLPLTHLKIDQSFVRDVLVDANVASIARTIVALGANLGLNVVAEGVETEGQRAFLVDIGCNAFQGYLYGRPVAIDEFEALHLAQAGDGAVSPDIDGGGAQGGA